MPASGSHRLNQAPAKPAGPFRVWVEIRCESCLAQIAGAYATRTVPHLVLSANATRVGALMVEDRWICACCAARLPKQKRGPMGIADIRPKP